MTPRFRTALIAVLLLVAGAFLAARSDLSELQRRRDQASASFSQTSPLPQRDRTGKAKEPAVPGDQALAEQPVGAPSAGVKGDETPGEAERLAAEYDLTTASGTLRYLLELARRGFPSEAILPFFTEQLLAQSMFFYFDGSDQRLVWNFLRYLRDDPMLSQQEKDSMASQLSLLLSSVTIEEVERHEDHARLRIHLPMVAGQTEPFEVFMLRKEQGWQVGLESELAPEQQDEQRRAVLGCLERIRTAEYLYARSRPDGEPLHFTRELSKLAPVRTSDGRAIQLLPSMKREATGTWAYRGYRFGPILFDSRGEQLDWETTFAFAAIPIKYGTSGKTAYMLTSEELRSRDLGASVFPDRIPDEREEWEKVR